MRDYINSDCLTLKLLIKKIILLHLLIPISIELYSLTPHTFTMNLILSAVVSLMVTSSTSLVEAASCTVTAPPELSMGAEVGLVLIPGAQIPGERYSPLAQQIQAQLADKAKVWVGVTKSFLGNFPNPLEISGAINDCLSQAAAEGLGGPVYMAGHSLGGIMLETYIKVTGHCSPSPSLSPP